MLVRFGSRTFSRASFFAGMRSSTCAMQFKRALRLLSERTMCHGAKLVSVAFARLPTADAHARTVGERVRRVHDDGLAFGQPVQDLLK